MNQNDIAVVFGMRGSGKSTLSRKLASIFNRVVIFDRLQEHNDGVVVRDFESFASVWTEGCYEMHLKIIIQFDIEEKSESQTLFFNEVLRVIYKSNRIIGMPLCIFIEEVHFFAGPTSIERWLHETILTGRHSNIALVVNSQRPASVHKSIVSQATHVFIGQLFEMRDILYLDQTVGEVAHKAKTLPKFHFIHYQVGFTPKIIK